MVDSRIVQYISDQLKKGYTKEQIRSLLLRYGYNAADIDAAFPTPRKFNSLLIFGLLGVVVVALLGYFLVSYSSTGDDVAFFSSQSIDMSVLASDDVSAGSSLSYSVTLVPSGFESGARGILRSTLFDSSANDVFSDEEMVSIVGGKQSFTLAVPSTLPVGEYVLNVQVRANGNLYQARTSFAVVEQTTSFTVVAVDSAPVVDSSETDDIVDLAMVDSVSANSMCLELSDSFSVDQCLFKSALRSHDGLFCSSIGDYNKKNSCYFNLVMATRDTSLCNGILDPNLKNTCLKIQSL